MVGLQAANRIALEDNQKQGRALQRTAENVCWQVSGSGKSQNQILKDLMISMSRLLPSVDGHSSKSHKIAESNSETLESIEAHLSSISDGIKKLVEQNQTRSQGDSAPPANPPVGSPKVDAAAATAAATAKAVTAAHLGTGLTPPKAMPLQPTVEGLGSAPSNLPSPVFPMTGPGQIPAGQIFPGQIPPGQLPPGQTPAGPIPSQVDPNLMPMAPTWNYGPPQFYGAGTGATMAGPVYKRIKLNDGTEGLERVG